MPASLFHGQITRFYHHRFIEGNVPLTNELMSKIMMSLQYGERLVTEDGVLFAMGYFYVEFWDDGRIELGEPCAE